MSSHSTDHVTAANLLSILLYSAAYTGGCNESSAASWVVPSGIQKSVWNLSLIAYSGIVKIPMDELKNPIDFIWFWMRPYASWLLCLLRVQEAIAFLCLQLYWFACEIIASWHVCSVNGFNSGSSDEQWSWHKTSMDWVLKHDLTSPGVLSTSPLFLASAELFWNQNFIHVVPSNIFVRKIF